MTEKTVVTLMATFSRAYPSQFIKMNEDDKRALMNTFMVAFGNQPDMIISEAAAVALRRCQFMPSLQEFAECIRRAEMILESRRINAEKKRERQAEAMANNPIGRAQAWEQALVMAGLTQEDAHRTAFFGIEPERIEGGKQ